MGGGIAFAAHSFLLLKGQNVPDSLNRPGPLLGGKVTAMLLWRLVVTIVAGLITLKLTVEAALLVPAVYGGVWMGRRYFRTVTPEFYQRLLQAIMLLSAIMLLFDGVKRVTGQIDLKAVCVFI
jgi:uncharacterized membrane protein YfcA